MDVKDRINEIKKFLTENENVFKQRVKNKLKTTGMKDDEAEELLNTNSETVKNSYDNKEKDFKTATMLKTMKKEDIQKIKTALIKEKKL